MIDYGNGLTNIDHKTGIRYGVIHHNEVGESWYEDSEAQYDYYCPYCGEYLKKGSVAKRCPACYVKIDSDRDFDCIETSFFNYKGKGIRASQSGDDCDIFITLSPYYTLCSYCSPCAPGAGYIMSQNPDGIKAYCFGHDWFEDGKAPHKVFSVKTDEEVLI